MPRLAYLVHGEDAAAQALRTAVEEEFRIPAAVPTYLERVAV
jgi:predicted metal-dependent RNase